MFDSHPDAFGERYVAYDTVGAGATATVYRARDTILGRDVAIKLPLPQFAHDDAFAGRFAREAAAAARLVHPNVACVFDVGRGAAGPYVVMEYVAGGSLRDLMLARGVLVERDAIAIGRAVAAALEAAHASGILHRDVKPANVLLASDGTPKLADFGATGTPGFRAPETARGAAATPASDLYALGATLFVATAGRLPRALPARLGTHASVSAAFASIVDRLLHDDPHERFASARDAAEAFAALDERATRVVGAAFADPWTVDAPLLDAPTLAYDVAPPASAPPPPAPPAFPSLRPRISRAHVRRAAAGIGIGALVLALIFGANAVVRGVARGFTSREPTAAHRRVAQRIVPRVLPDVVGLPFADARARLDRANVRSTTYPTASTAAYGTIVDQQPAGGTALRPGARVTLRLSVGPPVAAADGDN